MPLPTMVTSLRSPEVLGLLVSVEFAPNNLAALGKLAADLDGTGVTLVLSEGLPDDAAFRCTFNDRGATKVRSYKRDWSPL